MKQTSSQPRLDGKIPGRIKYTFALGALGKDMIYGMILRICNSSLHTLGYDLHSYGYSLLVNYS